MPFPDPAVFNDVFYFFLVPPPPEGVPREGPDCRFPFYVRFAAFVELDPLERVSGPSLAGKLQKNGRNLIYNFYFLA